MAHCREKFMAIKVIFKFCMLIYIFVYIHSVCAMPEFVMIPDAYNPSDPNGNGSIGYLYQIAKNELSIQEFQQAIGAGNGNENYWNDGVRTVGGNAPAVNISLDEAKKYCNYLTSGNVANGVYGFNNGTNSHSTATLSRNNILTNNAYSAWYAISTEGEWYKAAYYTGNPNDLWSLYATGYDTYPIHGGANGWNYSSSEASVWAVGSGGEEQNGTFDMMGNVWEIMQSGIVGRGGYFYSYPHVMNSDYRDTESFTPDYEANYATYRIVKIIPNWTSPLVDNGIASNITDNAALLTGTIVDTGNENPVVTIYWGEIDGGVVASNWEFSASIGVQSGDFSTTISGLKENREYYYRCYSENSVGFDWADESVSFSTLIKPINIVSLVFNSNTNLLIKWLGTNGWSYSLQNTTNLLIQGWYDIPGAVNIPGVNGEMSVTVETSEADKEFYRVFSNKL